MHMQLLSAQSFWFFMLCLFLPKIFNVIIQKQLNTINNHWEMTLSQFNTALFQLGLEFLISFIFRLYARELLFYLSGIIIEDGATLLLSLRCLWRKAGIGTRLTSMRCASNLLRVHGRLIQRSTPQPHKVSFKGSRYFCRTQNTMSTDLH